MENIKDILDFIDQNVSRYLNKNLDSFIFDEHGLGENTNKHNMLKPFCELCFLTNFLNKRSEIYPKIEKHLLAKIEQSDWDALLMHNSDLYIALISVDFFYHQNFKKSIFHNSANKDKFSLYLKIPYRMIEILTFTSIMYNSPYEDILKYKKLTVLGIYKNSNKLSYMDIYSITHELMYIYFLQKNNIMSIQKYGLDLNKAKTYLINILAFLYLEEHFDLLAEVILVLGLIDFQFDLQEKRLIKCALNKLAIQIRPDGSIIPHRVYKDKNKLSFADVYHTSSVTKGMVDIWKKKNLDF